MAGHRISFSMILVFLTLTASVLAGCVTTGEAPAAALVTDDPVAASLLRHLVAGRGDVSVAVVDGSVGWPAHVAPELLLAMDPENATRRMDEAGLEAPHHDIAQRADIIETDVGMIGHDPAHGHEHGPRPTRASSVWTDPVRVIRILYNMEAALSEHDPDNATLYASNAKGLAQALQATHDEQLRELRQCRSRILLVSEPVYAYYAHRYNLYETVLRGIGPNDLPTEQALQRVRAEAERALATHIVFPTEPHPQITALLNEHTGLEVAVVDPLLSEHFTGSSFPFVILQQNQETLKAVAGCS